MEMIVYTNYDAVFIKRILTETFLKNGEKALIKNELGEYELDKTKIEICEISC